MDKQAEIDDFKVILFIKSAIPGSFVVVLTIVRPAFFQRAVNNQLLN
jgi:hypothetical protein